MLLGEVGKLREERRNIQLFVSIPDWLCHWLTNSLVKLALSCAYEAITMLAACLIQIGEWY
jgi:hypothetical protein